MAQSRSLRSAALEVIRELGPLHYRRLTKEILSRGLATSYSKTPAASLNAIVAVDIKRNGNKSDFVRLRPGVFGLRGIHGSQGLTDEAVSSEQDGTNYEPGKAEIDKTEQRVRTPFFPTYATVRHLLAVWPGRPRKQITGLQKALLDLRGTPQNTVDWTDPGSWIPQRLEGEERELASAIWRQSGKSVNPRHTHGAWLLSKQYGLVQEDTDCVLRLSARGRDFVEHERGEAESFLDEQEGLLKILTQVAENGPTRPGGLVDEWADYLLSYSGFGKPSTIRDTLQRRLRNLLDRNLVSRKHALYSITEAAISYLEQVGADEVLGGDEHEELRTLLRRQETSVRESLRDLLAEMDPYTFESLVQRLLVEMNYQNVEVTARSGDGGVDVVADIELGITSVREVVQAKRHKQTIQRKDLDALRGSLYRFDAVRGTIITTSRFSKGTSDAAFASGAAPITLIDGDKLIDLLIENNIGVQKRTVDVLEVDPDAFTDLEPDE